jgi:hypothetical protein
MNDKKLTVNSKRPDMIGNKYAVGNKGGRPLLFPTPEILQYEIDKYFDKCDETQAPYTIMGLCESLDVDRVTLIDYKEREEFSHIIKRAKTKCEKSLYERGLSGKGNPALTIFGLKNNYGWRDDRNLNVKQDTTIHFVNQIGGPEGEDWEEAEVIDAIEDTDDE